MDEDYGAPRTQSYPTVWMRALRAHTYHGRPQAEGDLYLAHEHEVENIENLKFARREPPPPTAMR
jgi:hypothetical protein